MITSYYTPPAGVLASGRDSMGKPLIITRSPKEQIRLTAKKHLGQLSRMRVYIEAGLEDGLSFADAREAAIERIEALPPEVATDIFSDEHQAYADMPQAELLRWCFPELTTREAEGLIRKQNRGIKAAIRRMVGRHKKPWNVKSAIMRLRSGFSMFVQPTKERRSPVRVASRPCHREEKAGDDGGGGDDGDGSDADGEPPAPQLSPSPAPVREQLSLSQIQPNRYTFPWRAFPQGRRCMEGGRAA